MPAPSSPYLPWTYSLRLWLHTNVAGTALLSIGLIFGLSNSFLVAIPIGLVAGVASAVAVPVVALLLPARWLLVPLGVRRMQFVAVVVGAFLLSSLGFSYYLGTQSEENWVLLGFASPYLLAALACGTRLYWPMLGNAASKAVQ